MNENNNTWYRTYSGMDINIEEINVIKETKCKLTVIGKCTINKKK